MARIIIGSYMVRYPLGGMMSWVLQYLVGFRKLGHDVYFVEKSGYANACYDPVKDLMGDDCSYGGLSDLRHIGPGAQGAVERHYCDNRGVGDGGHHF